MDTGPTPRSPKRSLDQPQDAARKEYFERNAHLIGYLVGCLALRYSSNRIPAEDLTQEGLTRVWENFPRIMEAAENDEHLRRLIVAHARSGMVDAIRKATADKRLPRDAALVPADDTLPASTSTPDQELEDREEQQWIAEACVRLLAVLDTPYREIAQQILAGTTITKACKEGGINRRDFYRLREDERLKPYDPHHDKK